MSRQRQLRKQRVRKEIFSRDHFTCCDCGWKPEVPEEWDGRGLLTDGVKILTIDHKRERSLGGASTKDNFQTLCDVCNTKKSVHVGQMITQAQERGLSLEEARRHVAIRLGYEAA